MQEEKEMWQKQLCDQSGVPQEFLKELDFQTLNMIMKH
jgi:hypothetical protein